MSYQFSEEQDRFVVKDEQGNEAGEITYVRDGEDTLVINHTGVNPQHRGQGLAEKLVSHVVEKAKKEGLKIVPVCWFAKKEFDEKESYREVLKQS
ncbi:GNAT family N-acetyltransferase [Bacillus sp. REN3]|uniref:GNAT family N-acetyltransferase n=1 Tax=Bacillus sp. REN3 TaxID=2802440 RepID=UPI001AEEA400|nr:GNAT family N-acetyltransferase [Bacillus sp. REN3]